MQYFSSKMFMFFLFFQILAITLTRPIHYQFYSGHLQFNQSVKERSVDVPHIDKPIVLYAMDSLQVQGYFSYQSDHYIKSGNPNDTLYLKIKIGKVSNYQVRINYVVMEQMPNMQYKAMNITGEDNYTTFVSKKGISYSPDVDVIAYPMGFSSSALTQQALFYPYKQNSTYTVFTNMKHNQPFWLYINFIIIKKNYNNDNVFCVGSGVNYQSSINNKVSPIQIQIDDSLKRMFAIETIFLPSADFQFNQKTNEVYMNSSGTYSFNVILFNTTCEIVGSSNVVGNETLYLTLMVVFIIGFAILLVLLIWCYCKNKRLTKLNGVQKDFNVFQQEPNIDDRNLSPKANFIKANLLVQDNPNTGTRISSDIKK